MNRSPTGEVLKISKGATFQGGRIESLDEVIIIRFPCCEKVSFIKLSYIPVKDVASKSTVLPVTIEGNGSKLFILK